MVELPGWIVVSWIVANFFGITPWDLVGPVLKKCGAWWNHYESRKDQKSMMKDVLEELRKEKRIKIRKKIRKKIKIYCKEFGKDDRGLFREEIVKIMGFIIDDDDQELYNKINELLKLGLPYWY